MEPTRKPGTSLDLLALAGLLLIVGSAQFAHDRIVGSDGFFHVAQARRILTDDMPWMPLSIFADGWVDHQLLFHAALAPFAWMLDPITAAKVGAALFGALALWVLHLTLRRQGAPLPFLFALLPLAVSWQFLVRLEMPRVQGLSLALMLGCVIALLEGRTRLLFALAWVYAWTYQVALLVLPIAVLHALVSRLPVGMEQRRRAWSGPLAALAGLTAGFVVHPHSPGTLRFLWQHVVLKVLNRDTLPVGSEWLTGGPVELMRTGGGGVALLILAIVLLRPRAGRLPPSRSTIFTVLLASAATVGALLSTKFIEYSVPLSALAVGLSVRDARRERARLPAGAAALFVAIALVATAWSTLEARDAVLATEPSPHRLAPAMQWASEHIPPGERVFHFSWNDWPELVLHGPAWEYVVGLDPHFLQLAEPELWDLYDKIGRGWGANPSKPIAQRFGARWAILVLPYPGDPRGVLGADPGLRLAFDGEHALIYEVVGPGSRGVSAP
ncbi:MAG: hypothetical protein KDA24_02840 [Deltaproteobacteria bacterium]|nr:hypothetical protein [Deltaproteobacteria bacterium]